MEFLANLLTVAGQVATLFFMMAAGFVLGKLKWLTGEGMAQMSTVLLYVVTPCVMLEAFQGDNLPALGVLGVGVLALGSFYLVFMPLSFLLFRRAAPDTGTVLRFGSVYGNAGFMGLPLLEVVLGPRALIYGVVSLGIFNVAQWTHGAVVMGGRFSMKKAVLNPGVLGLLASLPLLLFHLRLPGPVFSAVSFLADLNTPLAMLVIGGQMAGADFRAIFTSARFYAAAALKLVAIPLATALMLLPFGLDPILYCTCVIVAATPSAGATSIFAQRFGRDTASAAQLVTLTTLLSILTLPVFVVLAQTLAG